MRVLAHPDGETYVGQDEDGRWHRWPAEAGGWERRTAAQEADAEGADEYSGRLARLALRLSGAPGAD